MNQQYNTINEILDEKMITKDKFSSQVEHLVLRSDGGISFMEAVIEVAKTNAIEIQDASKLLTSRVISKIESEACENRMIISDKDRLDAFMI